MRALLALAAAACLASSAKGAGPVKGRGSRAYYAGNRIKQNVESIHRANGAVTGVYVCCNLAQVLANGTVTTRQNSSDVRAEAAAIRQAIREVAGIEHAEVWHVASPSQYAIQNVSWKAAGAPQALAKLANDWNSTGFLIDYEPSTNYSQAQAHAYGDFLEALAAAVAPLKVGMDIAGWGVLKAPYWPAFASRGLARFTSMTPTYTGTDLEGDIEFVKSALTGPLPKGDVAFGIGTEVDPSCRTKWHYNWTEPKLRAFLGNVSAAGGRGVDMWRTDIDGYCPNGTASWMLDAVRDFVQGRI